MKDKSTCRIIEGDYLKINEENFIYELRKGNEKALDYVVDSYGWLVKTVVSKNMYGLESYREECINDCLLAVWENIDSFDQERSSFKNWLAGIAKYKSIDYLRKYQKEFSNISFEKIQIEKEDTSSDRLIERENLESIEGLLSDLKPRDRLIFKRLFIEEEDIDSLAEDLDLDKSNIYNRVSRGRRKLQKNFKEEDYVK